MVPFRNTDATSSGTYSCDDNYHTSYYTIVDIAKMLDDTERVQARKRFQKQNEKKNWKFIQEMHGRKR